MPRLRAEESIEAAARVSVGSGRAGTGGDAIVREWDRAIELAEAAVRPPAVVKASPAALRQMGVGVRKVRRGAR